MYGPLTAFGEELHAMKYRQPGETFRDAMNRVATALTDERESYMDFREILLAMRFMPAGRVQAAVGAIRRTTPYNCYVSGIIPDSFVNRDNPEQSSIMHRAEQAAATMRLGGGIGYDFSTLRPSGDLIKSLQSTSSGVVPFMKMFDHTGKATSSAGHRRGAQMGVLRVDHPDIPLFVNSKHDQDTLSGFNISVAVTDSFMEHLETGRAFPLSFEGRVYQEIDPNLLWEQIMRSTWDWGEPGVLFIDQINRMNNLWYCERLAATNPCGEQPLPPFGACLLGSFNLIQYIRQTSTGSYAFDWDNFIDDIPVVVEAMDNVVDVAIYPLPEQEHEAKSKRRMGLGYTALANAAETLGFPYGSKEFLAFEEAIGRTLMNEAYRSSALLAKKKGPFPLYDAEYYLKGKYIQGLDPDVLDLIRRYGIRNSHLTSIAPTGTISMSADNVSSGAEPVFSLETQRPVNTPDGQVIVTLQDYAYGQFGTIPKLAEDVTIQEHLDVLVTAQKYVDSAVSKTCNVSPSMPWDEFKGVYKQAFERGCKGVTTFNPEGKRMTLLRKSTPVKPVKIETTINVQVPQEQQEKNEDLYNFALASAGDACTFDPATGRKSCE